MGVNMTDYKHVVVLGDIHFPFHDKETLKLSLEYIKQKKPDLVLQIGDLNDNYNYSRFYKSPDIISPKEELLLARKQGIYLWQQIKLASPKAKCVQILGNHDIERLKKMSLTLAPALSHLVVEKITELMTFDGVETLDPEKDVFQATIQGEKVLFMHGCFSATIQHAKHYLNNVVLGHLHRSEIQYFNQGGKNLWAFNVGYMGDPKSPVFKYTQTVQKSWTQGVGIIDEQGPKFLSKRSLKRMFDKKT